MALDENYWKQYQRIKPIRINSKRLFYGKHLYAITVDVRNIGTRFIRNVFKNQDAFETTADAVRFMVEDFIYMSDVMWSQRKNLTDNVLGHILTKSSIYNTGHKFTSLQFRFSGTYLYFSASNHDHNRNINPMTGKWADVSEIKVHIPALKTLDKIRATKKMNTRLDWSTEFTFFFSDEEVAKELMRALAKIDPKIQILKIQQPKAKHEDIVLAGKTIMADLAKEWKYKCRMRSNTYLQTSLGTQTFENLCDYILMLHNEKEIRLSDGAKRFFENKGNSIRQIYAHSYNPIFYTNDTRYELFLTTIMPGCIYTFDELAAAESVTDK